MTAAAAAYGGGASKRVRKLSAALAKELRGLYGGVQAELFARLSMDLTSFEQYRITTLLEQIEREVAFLDTESARWARKAMRDTYRLGADLAGERLNALGVSGGADLGLQIHSGAIDVLAESVAGDLAAANAGIRKSISRYVRVTQQKVLADREISRMLARGLIAGDTRRTTSSEIQRALEARMGNQQFLTINGRVYEPEYYAELVARTRTREAVTEGTLNTGIQLGMDLVQVSVHNHPWDDPCLEYQGKVFSISGASRAFPRLTRKPPFHPHCRHVLMCVPESYLKARGQHSRLSTFSKSDKCVVSYQDFSDWRLRRDRPEKARSGPVTRAARARARRRSGGRQQLRRNTEAASR